MKTFANFLATLITLLLFLAWILPVAIVKIMNEDGWAMLYILIFILTISWGSVLHHKYFKQ